MICILKFAKEHSSVKNVGEVMVFVLSALSDNALYLYHILVSHRQCSAEAAFLRHCPTNFENDAAKTGPAGHLAHTDFGLAQDFESASLWSIPMPKITWGFTGIPVVVTVVLIGVLDF